MDLVSDASKSGTNIRHGPYLRHIEIKSLLLDDPSLHSLKTSRDIRWAFLPPLSKTLRGFLYGAPPASSEKAILRANGGFLLVVLNKNMRNTQ